MGLSTQLLVTAPRQLLAVGVGASLLGLWLLLWLLRRIALRLLGRARHPVGLLGGSVTLLVALALAGTAAVAFGLCVALAGYHPFGARTHVAEIQCIPLSPGKLRLIYVGMGSDGRRGGTETYELDGDECSVGGEILRFLPALTTLGVSPVHAVHRVEARAGDQAPAAAPPVSGSDRGAGTGWLLRARGGRRAPLAWTVAELREQFVSQRPARRAIYHLFVTPDGYVIDRRAF